VGGVPVPIRRLGYQVASKLLFVLRFVFRPSLRGVRCVLRRGDDVLIVRHTYGNRRWGLPGGAIKRREQPVEAARREMSEELGVDLAWRSIGDMRFVGQERARHHVFCFTADLGDADVDVNAAEIAEARWFPADGLPEDAVTGTALVVERALAA
jgi:8-oxo-dGTP pyrophosphatase MutT (NUDIX family)